MSAFPRIECRDLRQLLEQLALALGELRRYRDVELGEKVALAPLRLGVAIPAQANLAPGGGAGGDAHGHWPIQRLELRGAAESGLPGGDRHRGVQVAAL